MKITRQALADHMDAGLLREELAQELARWIAGVWISGNQATRFRHRVQRLAGMARQTWEQTYNDLREDASAILDEGE